MVAQHHASIVYRTLSAILVLWLLLAVIAWNAADTRPKRPATAPPPSVQESIGTNAIGQPTESPAAVENNPRRPQDSTLENTTASPTENLPADLLQAIKSNHTKAILRFVTNAKSVQQQDEQGDTALHHAVRGTKPLLAQLLLVHGADSWRVNNDGLIPIALTPRTRYQSYRFKDEQRDVLDLFIQAHRQPAQNGARAKWQAIFNYAARHGEFAIARNALAQGADPAVALGRSMQTLLHLNTTPKFVPSYVELGIPKNARDNKDRTALSLAVFNGKPALAQALLSAGAKVSDRDNYSDLGVAVSSGNRDSLALTRLMLKHGASINQREWMRAIDSRNATVVGQLMRHAGGFDPTSPNGGERIRAAQRNAGDGVLERIRQDPRIDGFVRSSNANSKVERTKAMASAAGWIAPHLLWLSAIITLLACMSLVPIWLANKGKRGSMLIGALSATAFVHLFLFNQAVETSLSQFRFFGEPAPAFRVGLMIIGDSIAFALGSAVGLAWALLPPRTSTDANAPRRVAGLTLYLLCFGVLIGHNLGKIEWPSKLYRTVTGYDAYTQRKANEKQQAKLKRKAQINQQLASPPPYAALFKAVALDDIDALNAAIANLADINVQDRKGNTGVHEAVYPPRPLMLQTLVKAGASVNVVNTQGQQPLHALVGSNFGTKSMPVLKQLLGSGADVNAADTKGMTPLCLTLASMKPQLGYTVANLLLKAGAEIDPSPHCSPVVLTQDLGLLRHIVQQGANIDSLHANYRIRDTRQTYPASALWSAAHAADLKRTRALIKLGADLENRDTQFGRTPLQGALSSRHKRAADRATVVNLLINAGAQTAQLASDGRSTAEFDLHQLLESSTEFAGSN